MQNFFKTIIEWQVLHGRQTLPWQNTRDPYRVWLSEIMLQQTQVAAVLGYFDRFINRFPDVNVLAQAHSDEVMAAWSGLGYYSRARNLHRCAQRVAFELGGQFPDNSQALQQLPGIGPSTAAAIAAFCYGEPISIFDGNVKRVLTRFLGFDGDLSQSAAEKRLMTLVQAKVPASPSAPDMARYTQGLMDLGATVCTRHQPACVTCPLAVSCEARRMGRQSELPFKSRRTKRSTVQWWLMVLRQPGGQVWLMQRPSTGIWADLYCFPAFTDKAELDGLLAEMNPISSEMLAPLTHALTHRDLILQPVLCRLDGAGVVRACAQLSTVFKTPGRWILPGANVGAGLPVPVSRWLSSWHTSLSDDQV